MKFLVVDDERDIEMLFKQKFRKELRKGDIELQFAFSGEEAMEILESKQPPDVMYIFSDINMLGMSGFDLLDEVKDQYPQIDVSMISAYGDSENYEKAINSGAKEFYTKPINFESIKKEVHGLLEHEG